MNAIKCHSFIAQSLRNQCSCFLVNNNIQRTFSISSVLAKSHYDALGISPKATQTDIKSAYYKLSMVYHPDKNKGSTDAAEQFRDISAAYEVLGNYKLRRLYDKGEFTIFLYGVIYLCIINI